MNYDPHTHLDIARQRQADLLREARKLEVARSVGSERPGLVARFRGLFGERDRKQPLPRPV